MRSFTTLLGAEDVRAAGNEISRAAQQMQSSAMAIDSVMERHHRFLDDWLIRFAEAMQITSPTGEANQSTSLRGHTSEYADADIVVTTRGEIVKSVDYTINVIVVDHLTGGRAS